tara:strand:- start:9765 stop:10022 length:258 start_codon:yes stop_codon:yes gene_type:complete
MKNTFEDELIYGALVIRDTVESMCNEIDLRYEEVPEDIREGSTDVTITVRMGDNFYSKVLREDHFGKDLFRFYCDVHLKFVSLLG